MSITFNRTLLRIQNKIYSSIYKEYVIEAKDPRGSERCKILEVGCGQHPLEGISCATDKDAKLPEFNPSIKIADVTNLPFNDKQFDLVISRNLLSCFDCIDRPDLKRQALREMQRVGRTVFVREFNKKLCPSYWKYRIRRFLRL